MSAGTVSLYVGTKKAASDELAALIFWQAIWLTGLLSLGSEHFLSGEFLAKR